LRFESPASSLRALLAREWFRPECSCCVRSRASRCRWRRPSWFAPKHLRKFCCVPFPSAVVVGRFRTHSCSNERLHCFWRKQGKLPMTVIEHPYCSASWPALGQAQSAFSYLRELRSAVSVERGEKWSRCSDCGLHGAERWSLRAVLTS